MKLFSFIIGKKTGSKSTRLGVHFFTIFIPLFPLYNFALLVLNLLGIDFGSPYSLFQHFYYFIFSIVGSVVLILLAKLMVRIFP